MRIEWTRQKKIILIIWNVSLHTDGLVPVEMLLLPGLLALLRPAITFKLMRHANGQIFQEFDTVPAEYYHKVCIFWNWALQSSDRNLRMSCTITHEAKISTDSESNMNTCWSNNFTWYLVDGFSHISSWFNVQQFKLNSSPPHVIRLRHSNVAPKMFFLLFILFVSAENSNYIWDLIYCSSRCLAD